MGVDEVGSRMLVMGAKGRLQERGGEAGGMFKAMVLTVGRGLVLALPA